MSGPNSKSDKQLDITSTNCFGVNWSRSDDFPFIYLSRYFLTREEISVPVSCRALKDPMVDLRKDWKESGSVFSSLETTGRQVSITPRTFRDKHINLKNNPRGCATSNVLVFGKVRHWIRYKEFDTSSNKSTPSPPNILSLKFGVINNALMSYVEERSSEFTDLNLDVLSQCDCLGCLNEA